MPVEDSQAKKVAHVSKANTALPQNDTPEDFLAFCGFFIAVTRSVVWVLGCALLVAPMLLVKARPEMTILSVIIGLPFIHMIAELNVLFLRFMRHVVFLLNTQKP